MAQPRVVAIVQARMGSERLPGKILAALDGQPVIWHVMQRLRRSRTLTDAVVATSTNVVDDRLVDYCVANAIRVVRGPEADVLSRFALALAETRADIVVRITADCPLVDPTVIDALVERVVEAGGDIDYASNTVERSFPRGMDAEVFTSTAFMRADALSSDLAWREHVTPAFYRLPSEFRAWQLVRGGREATSSWRLTVDTPEDLEALKALASLFPGRLVTAKLDEIEDAVRAHPEVLSINATIAQKTVR